VEFVRTQPPQVQAAFSTANDEQLETVVKQLARKELLLQQAEELGIELTDAEEQEIRGQARQAIRGVLEATGLAQGAATGATLDGRVKNLLEGAIAGRQQLVPLGQLAFALRDLYRNEINEGTFPQVIEELEEVRAAQPAPPAAVPQPEAPTPVPDPAG
jgi:hypothetical protein